MCFNARDCQTSIWSTWSHVCAWLSLPGSMNARDLPPWHQTTRREKRRAPEAARSYLKFKRQLWSHSLAENSYWGNKCVDSFPIVGQQAVDDGYCRIYYAHRWVELLFITTHALTLAGSDCITYCCFRKGAAVGRGVFTIGVGSVLDMWELWKLNNCVHSSWSPHKLSQARLSILPWKHTQEWFLKGYFYWDSQ